jgi:hypothetical protein
MIDMQNLDRDAQRRSAALSPKRCCGNLALPHSRAVGGPTGKSLLLPYAPAEVHCKPRSGRAEAPRLLLRMSRVANVGGLEPVWGKVRQIHRKAYLGRAG